MKCFCDGERNITTDGDFIFHHCLACGFNGVELLGVSPREVYFETAPDCSEGSFSVGDILYIGVKAEEIDLSHLDELYESL